MGQETVRAISHTPGLELVLAIDKACAGEKLRDVAGPRAADLVIEDKIGAALNRVETDVMIDFTNHASALQNAESALTRKVAPVIGATGVTQKDLRQLIALSRDYETPGMYVPNFAVGAVLMMKFAQIAAAWMPDVEIIELHHEKKQDAPSGTAMLTADRVADARKKAPLLITTSLTKVEGARGGNYKDIPMHSVRLPGLLAHQEVLFGGKGEVLTIKHDSMDRSSFMEGVKMCALRVWQLDGFTVGLDRLMFGD